MDIPLSVAAILKVFKLLKLRDYHAQVRTQSGLDVLDSILGERENSTIARKLAYGLSYFYREIVESS